MKAIWNGAVLAESDDTVVVDGNHYFPRESLNAGFFTSTDHHTTCPWKGVASYCTITVDGKENPNAAWVYPEPKEAASEIQDRFAFWKGVEVSA